MNSIGNRIRARRQALNLSCEDLGARVGMSKMKVSRIETGKIRILATDLERFATALEIEVAEFFA